MSLQIALRMVNGTLHEMEIQPGSASTTSCILIVKHRIAEELQIPVECQKLIGSGGEILDDDHELLNENGVIEMTLVVSDDPFNSARHEEGKSYKGRTLLIGADDRVVFTCCDFGDAGEGINVSGTAKVKLANCTIENCDDLGLEVGDSAEALLENCTISGCRRRGIYVLRAGTVYARGCLIFSNGSAFASNQDPGWESHKATLLVSGCTLESNDKEWMDSDRPGTFEMAGT